MMNITLGKNSNKPPFSIGKFCLNIVLSKKLMFQIGFFKPLSYEEFKKELERDVK